MTPARIAITCAEAGGAISAEAAANAMNKAAAIEGRVHFEKPVSMGILRVASLQMGFGPSTDPFIGMLGQVRAA